MSKSLEDLKKAADEYYQAEKKILDTEYEFIDKIIKSRGQNSVQDQNSSNLEEVIVKSIRDFLGS